MFDFIEYIRKHFHNKSKNTYPLSSYACHINHLMKQQAKSHEPHIAFMCYKKSVNIYAVQLLLLTHTLYIQQFDYNCNVSYSCIIFWL